MFTEIKIQTYVCILITLIHFNFQFKQFIFLNFFNKLSIKREIKIIKQTLTNSNDYK